MATCVHDIIRDLGQYPRSAPGHHWLLDSLRCYLRSSTSGVLLDLGQACVRISQWYHFLHPPGAACILSSRVDAHCGAPRETQGLLQSKNVVPARRLTLYAANLLLMCHPGGAVGSWYHHMDSWQMQN